MDDGFGVTPGAITMSAGFEIGAQFLVVVDLAFSFSLESGWCPVAMSMMLRRRMARPTFSSTKNPSSSGPRCTICWFIAASVERRAWV